MATLKDISRALDLSVTQVSRALNGHSDVAVDTRKRVEDMARSLNYRPNISARKLVSGRSGIVALVLTSYPRLVSDANLLETVAGLSTEFSKLGMQFVLHVASEGEDILDTYASLIDSGSLDGFVVVEPDVGDDRIQYLSERAQHIVVHGPIVDVPSVPFFDIDNNEVGRVMAQHLVAKGHQRIGFINGHAERAYAQARTDGISAVLASGGLALDPALVFNGQMDEALGLTATVRMFDGSHPPPTAIICGSVRVAKGCYQAVEALGLSIPADVSILAHDDVLPGLRASAFYPALTVTRSPLSESWRPLAEALNGAIEGRDITDLQRVTPVDFISRASVAAVPEKSDHLSNFR